MKIYVTGTTSNEKLFEVYKSIENTFSKLGHEVKTPLDTIELCKTHNDKERFDRAMKEINEVDFVISEVSVPSSGQGFELGVLFAKGFKNVVLISSDLSYTSGILMGAFGQPIIYKNDKLNELVKELKDKLNSEKMKD